MIGYKIGDIAAALGGHAVGNLDFVIQAASEPAKAGVLDLALAMDPKYSADLAKGSAKAAVLWADADWQALGLTAVAWRWRGFPYCWIKALKLLKVFTIFVILTKAQSLVKALRLAPLCP